MVAAVSNSVEAGVGTTISGVEAVMGSGDGAPGLQVSTRSAKD